MTTATTSLASGVSAQSRTTQLLLTAFLGVFVISIVGFSQMDVAHNAAHDYRHSMAFPCH
jgi:cobalt transporter subunit CbtB